MDADRANCVINNKSIGGNAAAINHSGSHNGGTECQTSTESSDSVEPPKSPFIETNSSNKNINAKHFDEEQCFSESNVDEEHSSGEHFVAKCTNSTVCSNNENDEILNSSLSDEKFNCLEATVAAAPTTTKITERITANNNSTDNLNNKNSKNQLNGDSNSKTNGNHHHHQQQEHVDNDDCDSRNDEQTISAAKTKNGTPVDSRNNRTNRIESFDKCAEHINNRDSDDIEGRRAPNSVQRTSHNNAVLAKQLSIHPKEDSIASDEQKLLLVQNSSEDCISTDTFSSDSIDVRPIKCPAADQNQVDGDHSSIDDEGKEKSATSNGHSNGVGTKKSTNETGSTMDDDDYSLRTPLLNKATTNDSSATSNQQSAMRRIKDLSAAAAATVANGRTVKTVADERDENRPLLQQSMSYDGGSKAKRAKFSNQKPKSIVKSPSTQNFGSTGDKFYEANRKPRLSIQCSGSDPERPVLHVQFLSQHESLPKAANSFESSKLCSPPATHDEQFSYQNSMPQHCAPIDNKYQPPEQLINQMPTRGILRTTRTRSSISSSSSGSSSSSSSSSESSDDVSQFAEAKPPDGGWGWVIVFASFFVNLIADGITFSFGVIYVELLKYFGEGKAKTAWIGSLFMAMPLLSGPVASWLTDRYGCRKVTIVGSILASIGFFISSFTDSIEMLLFTFGIFAGFGLSLCYVAAVVIVAYYFDKRRSFATGLSVCGSGIGTFIFAPLTQILIDEYGWRGTTLILSGVFLNMTVCGMLMRDLEWTTYKSKQKAKALRKQRNKLAVSADSFSASNSTNTGTTSNLHKEDGNGTEMDRSDENNGDSLANQSESFEDSRMFSSLITLPTFVKNGEKVPVEVLELLSANKNIHNVLLKNYPGLAHSRSFSQPLTSSRQSNANNLSFDSQTLSPTNADPQSGLARTKSRRIRNEQAFLTWLKEDPNIHHAKDVHMIMSRNPTTSYLKDLRMHRHSLTYRGAMLNINRYRLRASSCPDIYRNSMTTIAKEKSNWSQSLVEFKSVLVDMLDFSFFADIRFTLFALSNFLLYAWYDVPYVYLADYAVERKFSETDASILISLIGIVNMVGEIILGWFGDRKVISPGMIYAICMVFCGLVTGLVPLLTSYSGLSVLSGLFGLFIAANYALTSIILVELISLERFTNAYGLLLLVQGIANLIGPPLAGWITDLTGEYKLAFYLAGVFIAISGILMMLLPARGSIRKYRKYRRSQCEDDDDDEESSEEEETDIEKGAQPIILNTHQMIEAPKSVLRGSIHSTGIFSNGKTPIDHV